MILQLFILIYAHCMGDMIFQSDFIAKNKGKSILPMLSHITIYTGTVLIALIFTGMYSWWKPLFLLLGHLAIDSWKSRVPKDKEHWNCLYYDQAMHLAQIVAVWLL